MAGDRSFSELNLWQRIFVEHWDEFRVGFRATNNREVPGHWDSNVERMIGCGDIRSRLARLAGVCVQALPDRLRLPCHAGERAGGAACSLFFAKPLALPKK